MVALALGGSIGLGAGAVNLSGDAGFGAGPAVVVPVVEQSGIVGALETVPDDAAVVVEAGEEELAVVAADARSGIGVVVNVLARRWPCVVYWSRAWSWYWTRRRRHRASSRSLVMW